MASNDSLKNLTVQLLWDAGYISGSVLSPQPQNMPQLIQFIEAFPAEQPIAMDQIPETFESALFHLAGFDGAAFDLAKKYIATKLLSGAGLTKPGYQFAACLVAGWVPRWKKRDAISSVSRYRIIWEDIFSVFTIWEEVDRALLLPYFSAPQKYLF